MPDLPERPGHPSDTRHMVEAERHRGAGSATVSNPAFVIALGAIIAVVVALWLLLR